MASARRIAANRANAARSTGPKTAAGRRRSAANSARHGLTTKPAAEAVRGWFRVILDDPTAEIDPFERCPRRRAALALAEAEAKLLRARRAEEAALKAQIERAAAGRNLPDCREAEMIMEVLRENPGMSPPLRLLRAIVSLDQRETRLLTRYRAEAESARRTAFRHWLTTEEAFSRNEAIRGDFPKRTE